MASAETDFFRRTEDFLLLERAANEQEVELLLQSLSATELEQRGLALLRLRLDNVEPSFYGRFMLTLTYQRTTAGKDGEQDDSESDQQKKKRESKPYQTERGFPALSTRVRLPPNRFSTGAIVGLFAPQEKLSSEPLVQGVVHAVRSGSICVVVEDINAARIDSVYDACPHRAVHLALLGCDVTIERLLKAIDDVQSIYESPKSVPLKYLMACRFDSAAPRFRVGSLEAILNQWDGSSSDDAPSESLQAHNWRYHIADDVEFLKTQCSLLNEPQLEAIALALRARDVACIHGPPGTGKTTTLVACTKLLAQHGRRILVTAPSNVAVDNLLERCLAAGIPGCVRLGHPSRINESLLGSCLDEQIRRSSSYSLCADIRAEMASHLRFLEKLQNKNWKRISPEDYASRRTSRKTRRAELFALQKELWKREAHIVTETLNAVRVVFATCVGAGDQALKHLVRRNRPHAPKRFDVVIIDEAAQAFEITSWLPALLGNTLILAGDHRQLPPTVKSLEAEGLKVTLFEKWHALHGERISHMLTIQYRMHEDIMAWSSERFYKSALIAHPSARYRSLAEWVSNGGDNDDDDCGSNPGPPPPLMWIDTAGIPEAEESALAQEDAPSSLLVSTSRSNPYEAQAVRKYIEHLFSLLSSHVNTAMIGVITPYSAQVELIRDTLLESSIEMVHSVFVSTVDGFQGQEREIIIVSLVRSNVRRNIGFLRDHRRMNVAVTRAKRHLAIIGDSETVCVDPVLQGLFETVLAQGRVESAVTLMEGCVSLKPLLATVTDPASHQNSVVVERTKKKKKTKSKRKKGSVDTEEPLHGAPQQSSSEDDEERRHSASVHEKYYQIILQRVLESGEPHTFPSTLSSLQRRMIHRLAERFDLVHVSTGDKSDRRLTVSVKGRTLRNSSVSPSSSSSSSPSESSSSSETLDLLSQDDNQPRQRALSDNIPKNEDNRMTAYRWLLEWINQRGGRYTFAKDALSVKEQQEIQRVAQELRLECNTSLVVAGLSPWDISMLQDELLKMCIWIHQRGGQFSFPSTLTASERETLFHIAERLELDYSLMVRSRTREGLTSDFKGETPNRRAVVSAKGSSASVARSPRTPASSTSLLMEGYRSILQRVRETGEVYTFPATLSRHHKKAISDIARELNLRLRCKKPSQAIVVSCYDIDDDDVSKACVQEKRVQSAKDPSDPQSSESLSSLASWPSIT